MLNIAHTTPHFSRKARKQSQVRKAPPIPFIYGAFRKRKGEKESGRGVLHMPYQEWT